MTATLETPVREPGDHARERHPLPRRSLFDGAIVRPAIIDALDKLDPRVQAKNPVMFVVEVGSVLTTILFLKDLGDGTGQENAFAGLVAAWLWFTVLFANFAEAMAEGRGKAQAATLRKTRQETRGPSPPAPTARSRRCRPRPSPSATSAWSPPAR